MRMRTAESLRIHSFKRAVTSGTHIIEGVGQAGKVLSCRGGEATLAQRLAQSIGVDARPETDAGRSDGEGVEIGIAQRIHLRRLPPTRRERLVQGRRPSSGRRCGTRSAGRGVHRQLRAWPPGRPRRHSQQRARRRGAPRPAPVCVPAPGGNVRTQGHGVRPVATGARNAVVHLQDLAGDPDRPVIRGLIGPGVVERVEGRPAVMTPVPATHSITCSTVEVRARPRGNVTRVESSASGIAGLHSASSAAVTHPNTWWNRGQVAVLATGRDPGANSRDSRSCAIVVGHARPRL